MQGMSGQFNATVQQQIDGTATAPIGGAQQTPAPSNPSPSPSAPAANTPSKSSAPAHSSGSPTPSAGAGASAKDSGAFSLVASGATAVVGSFLAAAMLL